MDHKQKMMAVGAGAVAMLLLLGLGAILMAGGCGADKPRQTAQQTGSESTVRPTETKPTETTQPAQTQPPETTAPPATEPPESEPEITEPPETEPEITEPPETTAPPATEPPETEPEITEPPEAVTFQAVNESVTAKIKTNLRSVPSQGEESTVLYTLPNGQWITRTGVSDSGWSRLEWNGQTCYAVSNYLTTDPNYVPPEEAVDDGINTVFTACNDRVTAKELVNLRSIPSVTRADSVVVAQLPKDQWITRTGINTDVGWSRVEYNGQTLYCITSYLLVEDTQTQPEG